MQIISTISTCPVRAGAGPWTHNCCTADTRLPGAQSCRARVSLQLQFAGIFRRCADILHTPESAVRCGPGTSWRLQLQWCNSQLAASHNSPHTTPPACPRPELWASTCLAQSVLSGERSVTTCVCSLHWRVVVVVVHSVPSPPRH